MGHDKTRLQRRFDIGLWGELLLTRMPSFMTFNIIFVYNSYCGLFCFRNVGGDICILEDMTRHYRTIEIRIKACRGKNIL